MLDPEKVHASYFRNSSIDLTEKEGELLKKADFGTTKKQICHRIF